MSEPAEFRALTQKWGMVYKDMPDFRIDVHSRTVWKDYADEEGVKLLQFTGKRDKNFKKIYAEDIIRVDREENKSKIYSVIYYDDLAAFRMRSVKFGGHYNMEKNQELIEVIGNVWENPELLILKDA